MNILITGADTKEAFATSGILLEESIDFKIVGRNSLDIGFLYLTSLPEDKIIKETIADEIEYTKEKKFTHVLPFADFTQWALAKRELEKLGIKVIVNSFESIRIVNDYFDLYKKCREDKIIHPRTYKNHNEINYFPLEIKSRDKKNCFLVDSMRDVYNLTSGRRDVLVQQHLKGDIFKVIFIKNWCVCFRCLNEYIMEIIENCPSQTKKIIKSFGLDFGTLKFVNDSFIDAKPYIEWEFLGAGNFVLMNLLGENRPSSFVPGDKITKIPSVF